jgi:hypothetical protein
MSEISDARANIQSKNPKDRDNLEKEGVEGDILLKWILNGNSV